MSIHFRTAWAAATFVGAALSSVAAEMPSVPSESYVWRNVAIGGGGFVTGIVAHPRQKGLMYARTDVGGAYRWDDAAHRWIPLTDWIGPADWNLTGIESVAVDPADPRRVYLAAGTYSRFPAAILRSDDQGQTFQRTDLPVGMGGNEPGRFAGERLAIDPNDGAVLFFGSRHDGLWRSADRGQTWARVETFPKVEDPADPSSTQAARPNWNRPIGIVVVAFDPASGRTGQPTPVVYAAVSTVGIPLYRSADAGKTWAAVNGQPIGMRPNHLVISPDGALYVSYGREVGPGPMTAGSVWKYRPERGGWTDISPLKGKDVDQPFGYGCVAVDPRHPATVYVTTFGHWKPHDQIFRSTDAGATWQALWDDDSARWDYASAPYTATRTPHWMGTVVVNPFNADQVLFTTGYGIWASTDMQRAEAGQPVRWEFLDDGLEETVPLALISPPTGAHLISGLGDIDGFRHEEVEVSPAAGTFIGPRFSSTRDLAFATAHPTMMVRIGNAGRDVPVHIALSEDGGRTWRPLASDPPGGGNGTGRVALSADGRNVVWALAKGGAFATADHGISWTACEGIASEVDLAADPLDDARFYAFDPRAGRLWVSTDSGRHFVARTVQLPGLAADQRGDLLAVAPGRAGDVWIGSNAAGLFHSTDAGVTFQKLRSIEAAEAVGFGKPAPGNVFPAIYLRGKIGGLQAFYRSDDGGGTWVRINDDRHQYGSANRPMIIGDPRIYGRVYLTTGGRGIIMGDRK